MVLAADDLLQEEQEQEEEEEEERGGGGIDVVYNGERGGSEQVVCVLATLATERTKIMQGLRGQFLIRC